MELDELVFKNLEGVKETIQCKMMDINEVSLADLQILINALQVAYSVQSLENFDYIFDVIMETMVWCDVPTIDAFDFVWQTVKKICMDGQLDFFKNSLSRLWNFKELKPTTGQISELLFISLRNNRNNIAFSLFRDFRDKIDLQGIPEFLLKPIFFWETMREKSRNRAQKKIYFWWIPLCYDMRRPSGQHMAKKFLETIDKLFLEV